MSDVDLPTVFLRTRETPPRFGIQLDPEPDGWLGHVLVRFAGIGDEYIPRGLVDQATPFEAFVGGVFAAYLDGDGGGDDGAT